MIIFFAGTQWNDTRLKDRDYQIRKCLIYLTLELYNDEMCEKFSYKVENFVFFNVK